MLREKRLLACCARGSCLRWENQSVVQMRKERVGFMTAEGGKARRTRRTWRERLAR